MDYGILSIIPAVLAIVLAEPDWCPLSGTYASGKSSLCHQGQQKADYYAAHGLGSGRNPGKADEVCI